MTAPLDPPPRSAPEWRLFRGWSEHEIRERLAHLSGLERNFRTGAATPDEASGWNPHGSCSIVGHEAPGRPEPAGGFERGKQALRSYAFSDPSIVEAHYEKGSPLRGRRMLLELKPTLLHYLCPVVVSELRSEADEEATIFGFRYDTLEGHIERGFEWFLLEKRARSGELHFRIEATWMPGSFPNWWSRMGFFLIGRRYQRTWHRRAHRRMARAVGSERARSVESGSDGVTTHGDE